MKTLFFVFALVVGSSLQAQSLFKPIPRPLSHFGRLFKVVQPAGDSSFTGFRFTGPTVFYVLPHSGIFTGAGLSYEHATFKAAAGKWSTDWSIALEGYAGGQFAPQNVEAVTAIGLSVSFFNKLLTVGVLYNLTTHQVQGGIGPTVGLNN